MRESIRVHVRPRMGTLLAISVPFSTSRHQAEQVRAAFAMAADAEAVMSRFDPASALARLNQRAGRSTGVRSRVLARIVRRASDLSRRLDGAFDPTVAPVVDLWRRAGESGELPTPCVLRRRLASVGIERVQIQGDRITLPHPGMSLDLGGIGKGLALDRIAAMLRRGGWPSACLNFGESTLVSIEESPSSPWRVVLRDPFGAGFIGAFELRGRACSTSSTMGQFVRVQGRALGHVIDPYTGRPLTHTAQATVLAKSAAVAEAVSTALLVRGRHAVDEVADRMEVEICWIDRAGAYTTSGFGLRRTA